MWCTASLNQLLTISAFLAVVYVNVPRDRCYDPAPRTYSVLYQLLSPNQFETRDVYDGVLSSGSKVSMGHRNLVDSRDVS